MSCSRRLRYRSRGLICVPAALSNVPVPGHVADVYCLPVRLRGSLEPRHKYPAIEGPQPGPRFYPLPALTSCGRSPCGTCLGLLSLSAALFSISRLLAPFRPPNSPCLRGHLLGAASFTLATHTLQKLYNLTIRLWLPMSSNHLDPLSSPKLPFMPKTLLLVSILHIIKVLYS